MHFRRASIPAQLLAVPLLLAAFAQSSIAEEGATRVAIIELDSTPPGYAVVVAGARHRGTLDMLNGLATDYEQGDQLAVLFAAEVPIEAIASIASMASKVGYFGDTLKLFILDHKRKGMFELSIDKDWVAFSTEPRSLAELFQPN